MDNSSLHSSKKLDDHDEFYTQLKDIENELRNYKIHFRDKIVYCNCDDPTVSNFFKFFYENFNNLKLKKLITTCYKNQQKDLFSKHNTEKAIYMEYTGKTDIKVRHLNADGDFRSKECIELLKQADIVVTNPPFSLFREYIQQLIDYSKKFLIIGNENACHYKEIFPSIKDGKLWLGLNSGMEFETPNDNNGKSNWDKVRGGYFQKLGVAVWFTNIGSPQRKNQFVFANKFDPKKYPSYDNYDAIEVNEFKNIPDYDGVMGVYPATFLKNYNHEQFEIVKFRKGDDNKDLTIKGKPPYIRLLIRRREPIDDYQVVCNIIKDKNIPETEKRISINSRVGQDKFREDVLKLSSICPITGIDKPELLIASHIKPWVKSNHRERLDPNNGIPLTPTYDHLFDKGFITFMDDGEMIISESLSEDDRKSLNVAAGIKYHIIGIGEKIEYLKYHREHIFQN